ncbi:type II toxin-antitoxin system HicA family toxin [Dehalococcoidia bacterium]|nr:type II toxin-antitoxin system HicA family toxin [Dehalococcoidia bacterium]MCL0075300.1 type II toxin-antitoxin system HicA family toxin [Dehalococcoidia bacterium]MCL0078765.1 type II toxin-antitoxin system HicA family toxin [Dehalococcoidia bacterium]MCL0090095.1 type II toxin-antitoxin system HicA family toxin [Dehalococcoidia bacterium]MCL0097128.1 type II toxin-antitoxin system HicA family toxin [Dehalococcoidia bacterium]
MTQVPSLSYRRVVNALQRAGFVVVRQRGSHIRLQKRAGEQVFKLTVPSHSPIKKTTLAKIIKEAGLTVEEFRELI